MPRWHNLGICVLLQLHATNVLSLDSTHLTVGIGLIRKMKELSSFSPQTRADDSSCLSHELVSGGVAFSLHLSQQGPRGRSYDFSIYCLIGCIST